MGSCLIFFLLFSNDCFVCMCFGGSSMFDADELSFIPPVCGSTCDSDAKGVLRSMGYMRPSRRALTGMDPEDACGAFFGTFYRDRRYPIIRKGLEGWRKDETRLFTAWCEIF